MNIADRLKELRKKAGYSQEQLAGMLDVSRQAVSKWESAQGNPDIENLVKLTEIYHVSADYILTGHTKEDLQKVSETCDQRTAIVPLSVFVAAQKHRTAYDRTRIL